MQNPDRFAAGAALRALLATLGTALVANLLLPAVADAHVKWFVTYDIMCPPRAPFQMLMGRYFLSFCLWLAPLMFVVSLADRYLSLGARAPARWLDELADRLAERLPLLLRATVAVFFVALACYGNLILTPELRTSQPWVATLQLAIAASMLSRRTSWLGALGMLGLFALAVAEYGVFHMLDYPIFLGIAAYLAIDSRWRGTYLDIGSMMLRVSTGLSLLWGGIEKFAYPEWSYMLLQQRPELTMGFNPEFFLVAAGFVEVCAAFLMIAGLLAARAAAALLLAFMITGVIVFGMVDAIGHLLIMVPLVMIILSRNSYGMQLALPTRPLLMAGGQMAAFYVTLLGLVGAYYGGHYLSFQA